MTFKCSRANHRILIVDEDHQFGKSLEEGLQHQDVPSLYTGSESVINSLAAFSPDIAVINARLGAACGIELLSHLKSVHPELFVIIMVDADSCDSAVRAFRAGAGDYICKPFDVSELITLVATAATRIAASFQIHDLKKVLARKVSAVKILEQKAETIGKELELMKKELATNIEKAGLAEVSTSVLHNVGNILTSVLTSCQLVKSRWNSTSKQDALMRGINRLKTVVSQLPEGTDENLSRLPEFFTRFEKLLKKEQEEVRHHIDRIENKLELIKNVIRSQQSYASAGFQSEDVFLHEMVEDTLTIHESTLNNRGIRVDKHYDPVPKIFVQKTKLLHILVNLFKNAWESMEDEKLISVAIKKGEKWAYLHISDSGCGIYQENLKKIFEYGFTTKSDGHGFGLHSCAEAMTEMGGAIWAESEGPGKGSTFTLRFPLPVK